MRAARLLAAATLALLLAGCGSDLGPPRPTDAPRIGIGVLGPAPALEAGVADAERLLGARRATPANADLLVGQDAATALAAARAHPDAAVLLVGAPAPAGAPSNLLAVTYDRPEIDFLAGAVAGLAGGSVAIAGPPSEAFAAGLHRVAPGRAVRSGTCAGRVAYLPGLPCQPPPHTRVIAPARIRGAAMLAVVAPRPSSLVFATARAVLEGSFAGGSQVAGLREEGIGLRWLAPDVRGRRLRELQTVEDEVRAGSAGVPGDEA